MECSFALSADHILPRDHRDTDYVLMTQKSGPRRAAGSNAVILRRSLYPYAVATRIRRREAYAQASISDAQRAGGFSNMAMARSWV